MVSVRSHLVLSPMGPEGRSRDTLVFCHNEEEVIVIYKNHNVFII